jgi:hypothetical protein
MFIMKIAFAFPSSYLVTGDPAVIYAMPRRLQA